MQREQFNALYPGATLMLLFAGERTVLEFFRVDTLDAAERVAYLQPVDQDGHVRRGLDLCVVPACLLDRYAILDDEWCLPDPFDPGPDGASEAG